MNYKKRILKENTFSFYSSFFRNSIYRNIGFTILFSFPCCSLLANLPEYSNCDITSGKLQNSSFNKEILLSPKYYSAIKSFTDLSLRIDKLYHLKSPVILFDKAKGQIPDISTIIEEIIIDVSELIQYDSEIDELLCPLSPNLLAEIKSKEFEKKLRNYVRLYNIYFDFRKKIWGKSKFLKANNNRSEVSELNKYILDLKHNLISSNCEVSIVFLRVLQNLEFGILSMLKTKDENMNSSIRVYNINNTQLKSRIKSNITDCEITEGLILDSLDTNTHFDARVEAWDKDQDFWYIRIGSYSINAKIDSVKLNKLIEKLVNEEILKDKNLFYSIKFKEKSKMPGEPTKYVYKTKANKNGTNVKELPLVDDFIISKTNKSQKYENNLNLNALRFLLNSILIRNINYSNSFFKKVLKENN